MTRTPYGEAIVVLLLGWWGVWLLLPFHTFGSAPAYRTMAEVAPEQVWGSAFVGTAILHAYALWKWHRTLRMASLIFQAAAWAFLAVMLYQGNKYGIGWGQYVLLSLACIAMAARPTRAY